MSTAVPADGTQGACHLAALVSCLDVLPEAAIVLNPAGVIRSASRLACEILGYAASDLTGLAWLDLVLPEDRLRIEEAMQHCLNKTGVCRIEHRLQTGGGTPLRVESCGRPLAGPDGAPIAFVVTVRDVEDRWRQQVEAEANRHYLQAVLDTVNDAVFVDDARTGEIIDVNRRMCEMYGYTREEALRVPIGDLSLGEPPYSQTDALAWLQKARQEGPQTFEWRARRKDGELFWVEVSIVFTEIGGAERFVVLAHDISQRQRTEAERLEIERRMLDSQRFESLGVLAGGLAHDFNNLLMALSGSLDLARLRLPPDSPAGRPIAQAKVVLGRAADLTKQMLAVSGRGRVAVEPVSVSRVVEGMGALLASTVPPPAELRVLIDSTVPEVHADAAQLRQVVLNLVLNAVEACSGMAGKVELRVKVRDCDAEYLAASCLTEKATPGTFVALSVADNGCGIDEPTRRRVFDPFFSTKLLGRGLGLPAVLGIVRAHRGALLVESAVGWGTTVTVLLPVITPESRIAPAGEPGASAEAHRQAILVVEDQAAVREVTVEMLEEAGYRTLSAADGAAAVAAMRAHGREIDCVLLDLSLPSVDGVATLGLMREVVPHVRVVVASASSVDEVSRRFAGHPVAGVLQKPYDVQTLLGELRRVLKT